MLFKRIHPAPLGVPTSTTEATTYLYRAYRLTAIYTTHDIGILYKLWRLVNISIVIIYPSCSFAINFYFSFDKFTPNEFLTSLQLALNAWGFLIKISILYWLVETFEKAKGHIDRLDKSCIIEAEQLGIRKASAYGNTLFLIFTVIYTSYSTSSFLGELMNGRPPFKIYIPYLDWRGKRSDLYIQALLEYIVVGFAVFQNQTIDATSVIFVEMLRAHVNILRERIGNLCTDPDTTSDQRYKSLVNCILDHKEMLQFCDVLRPFISGVLFFQFLVCGSVIGIAVINITIFADTSSAIGTGIYLLGVFAQTFPLCFYCNCLITDCDALADGLFHSNWVYEDKRYRKTVLHFLQKLQQPMTFAAMNIFPITLDTNIKAAKFAFTVYTMAKEMNLADKFIKD